ncbi:MAG: discoidin domain-containing protein [Archangium sp.]|nr:discoidin domain-containing protein [Archangium sp.]
MDSEQAAALAQAHDAFREAAAADTTAASASRIAFQGYQRAVTLLRAGSPVVREEDERSGLEFLLHLDPNQVEDAALDEGVSLLRVEATQLLGDREETRQRREQRGWSQPVELVGPALVLMVLCVAGYTLGQRALEPTDIAEGKPWVASSSWATCTPKAGRCGPLTSRILFHTLDDDSPWFRIDLGEPKTMSGATIINRSDDVPERAVPLLIEVGDDGSTFREVARRESQFSVWRASFDPVKARFVRVRVPRKTWLHLEAVKIHP